MQIKTFEFKAKVSEIDRYEAKLQSLNPVFQGTDHQIDTYFHTTSGRLKLREGTIENALIQYDRENSNGSKESQITLYKHTPDPALKAILTRQLGIKTVVDKKRKIYFIDNVKFHFDFVENLGSFIEVEAIDTQDVFTQAELKNQCDHYFRFFELTLGDTIHQSYSDLILALQENN